MSGSERTAYNGILGLAGKGQVDYSYGTSYTANLTDFEILFSESLSSMSAKGFTILKQGHTGITVASLDQALKFWEDLLGGSILYRNQIAMSPEMNIMGVPDAFIHFAIISLPDSSIIELLEYSAPADRKVYKPRGCDVGSVHVALEVQGSKALIEQASAFGWKAVAEEPQPLLRGDGTKWTAVYIFGPDGEAVELLEKLEG